MGSIEKRVEALERRLGGPEPVRIVVVYEDAPREPLQVITLGGDKAHPASPGARKGGGRWGA